MVKCSVTKCHFDYQTFYHSNSKLLVRFSKHGLNNRPFDEQTVLNHLNTELVRHSDAHCTGLPYRPRVENWQRTEADIEWTG